MNAARIRGFLLQLPKPSRVMITAGDAEPAELKLGRSYAKVAETIEAKGVDLIECFDSQGTLLRAMRVSASDAQRSDAAAIPAGIEADPNALMLTHFANLIHRAYEHSTEIAFARMVDITSIMSQRSESIEARLERSETSYRRLQQQQMDDAYDRAEDEAARVVAEAEGGGFVDKMASAFLGGQLAPKPATNGKSKGQS